MGATKQLLDTEHSGSPQATATGKKNNLPEVYEAIINVMSELGAISKSRKNTQQGYAFRGVDDVLNSLQPLLIKNKLIILPEVIERTEIERTSKTGGLLLHVIVRMKISCISAIDGSSIETIYVGEAMDSGDKATNKAMSTAYKYFAFQTFCIPTDEPKDPENQTPEIGKKIVLPHLPESKMPEVAKFIANGGAIEQVKQKYQLTASQLKTLTEA